MEETNYENFFIIPMKRCPHLVIIVNDDECLSAHHAILIFDDSYVQLFRNLRANKEAIIYSLAV